MKVHERPWHVQCCLTGANSVSRIKSYGVLTSRLLGRQKKISQMPENFFSQEIELISGKVVDFLLWGLRNDLCYDCWHQKIECQVFSAWIFKLQLSFLWKSQNWVKNAAFRSISVRNKASNITYDECLHPTNLKIRFQKWVQVIWLFFAIIRNVIEIRLTSCTNVKSKMAYVFVIRIKFESLSKFFTGWFFLRYCWMRFASTLNWLLNSTDKIVFKSCISDHTTDSS